MRKFIPISGAIAALIITSALSGCGGGNVAPVTGPTTTSAVAKVAADAKAATAAKVAADAKAATAAKVAADAKADAAAAAKAAAAQAAAEAVPPPEPIVESVSYANCAAVRAAGADPIHRGDPGYSSKLDRDGDGIACE
jgi:hypothetical protein